MANTVRWKKRAPFARRTSATATASTPLRALAAGITQVARAALAEPYMLTVERQAIALRRLPRSLTAFRIVHFQNTSQPFTGSDQIKQSIETANSLEPGPSSP